MTEHYAIHTTCGVEKRELHPIESVFARILRDDGAAVYVNGVEVYRDSGLRPAAAHNELADYNAIGDVAADESGWYYFPIDPKVFREGLNVIAVEVHQHALNSSDLSFDFEITAFVVPVPEPESSMLVLMGVTPIAVAVFYCRRGSSKRSA